jgi:tetratricopeptide (TPR) repeat protein
MKNLYKNRWIIAVLAIVLASCGKMDVAPTNQISTESLGNTSDGIINVTNGNYALFKNQVNFNGFVDDNNMYLRQYFQLADFAADEIVCGQKTEDPLYYSFTYTHSPDQANSRFFWYVSYKIANGANTVIEILEDKGAETDAKKQILGENYFLRAFVHFNLLKFYSKAYTTGDPNTNLGVIIRNSTSGDSQKARATVQETYGFIIADLVKAVDLMNKPRGKEYASKEAAQAMLSRVYLSMGNNDKAIEYADQVINSGRFSLETASSYPSLFANALSHDETIWAVAFTPSDNRGKFGSIASMLYSDGNSGWGEEFASPSYRNLLADNLNDVRISYIDTSYNDDGSVRKKNGIEVYYIKKFSFQDGDPNLSSPIMFRLAEMYLNKAEAYANKGDEANAFAMLNEIRKNRGLADDLVNSVPSGKTLIDVVLDERSRELAFEGFRATDLIRNHKTIKRDYWGYHITGLTPPDIDLSTTPSGYDNLEIPYNDSRILYYIPVDEILANNLCVQN